MVSGVRLHYVFTSCCLITVPNNVLRFHAHNLNGWQLSSQLLMATTNSQLTHYPNCQLLTATIPWLTQCSNSVYSLSESELIYNWRFTVNQFVMAPSLLRLAPGVFFFCATEPLWSYSLCNILSDGRMGLSLMNRLGLCQVYVLHI
jgi:hypothetical protein